MIDDVKYNSKVEANEEGEKLIALCKKGWHFETEERLNNGVVNYVNCYHNEEKNISMIERKDDFGISKFIVFHGTVDVRAESSNVDIAVQEIKKILQKRIVYLQEEIDKLGE